MGDTWTLVALLIVTTILIRASGPVLLGGRELPERVAAVIALTAPALLAALVATETFGDGGTGLTVDERALGVAGAGVALAFRGGILVAMLVAMAVTAGARALG